MRIRAFVSPFDDIDTPIHAVIVYPKGFTLKSVGKHKQVCQASLLLASSPANWMEMPRGVVSVSFGFDLHYWGGYNFIVVILYSSF